MNSDLDYINIEIDSGVCSVTMNRLEKKNAINPQFAMELCNAWDVIDNDDEVRAKRKVKYKVKSTYISDDDALMFKESTDCNDNYRKDGPELKMSDFEDMCIGEGGQWTQDSDNSCASFCSNNGINTSFDSMCWNYYFLNWQKQLDYSYFTHAS